MTKWHKGHESEIRELWADGMTGPAIAKRFKVTRGQVAGIIHRWGLGPHPQGRKPGSTKPTTRVNTNNVVKKRAAARNFGGVWSGYPDKAESFVPREADIIPLNLSILEVNDSTCKFGYGDGPFTFCGHPVAPGNVYCAAHCRITYTSPKERTPAQQAADEARRFHAMQRSPARAEEVV